MSLSISKIVLLGSSLCSVTLLKAQKPNVIIILADDLGYGDISAYNENSKVYTPYIDQLSESGVIFTDAHAASSLSTPSRYGLLTGRYPWRSELKKGVLNGYSSPLIKENTKTIAQMFSENGYYTACIGKWHLGLNWGRDENSKTQNDVNYHKNISDGPVEKGFDYFFGLPASLDMPPYVFIENDKVITIPDHNLKPDKGIRLIHGGPAGKGFEPEQCLSELFRKSTEYVHSKKNSQQPFFLYMPITAPHTPVLPLPDYQGCTSIGAYGDFIVMIDDLVGKLVKTLEEDGLLDNTIIVFTSDNGCAPYVNVKELERQGHYPSYIYRGYKTDIYEGGHRVPLIISWKGHIVKRTESSLVSLTDMFATFADMLGNNLGNSDAVDSFSIWPILQGVGRSTRKDMIYESGDGYLSFRTKKYKLVFHGGSGGWGYPNKVSDLEKLPPMQFFDLENDFHENINLIENDGFSSIVKRMTKKARKDILSGRSNSGKKVNNDTDSDWKQINLIFK